MTPARCSDVPEVLLSQEVPSDEVRMIPPKPTVTKMLFPYVTSLSWFEVPEVLLSQVVPSEEVRMVPDSPTVTNNPVVVELSVLVVLDVLLLQEKRREENIRMEMNSIFFTWFPIGWF